ncbi:hypothetical protein CSKR_107517 [Clonorchis sinensis]|uniref:Uncharacterized protein n=1 Tax=Clonorchis sinensis TaxID=79923 RepID=A0A3R7JW91_CLOSI|nr:hypothetical protein CSKR_107517 [Clonorchis sinensis]
MLNAPQGAAQSVRHTGSGVRFNGKNVHSTPCATHKSVVRTQRVHNGEQTQVTDCDLRKSQSNNSFGGLRKADPSIRDDHRLVDQKVHITTNCTFTWLQLILVSKRNSCAHESIFKFDVFYSCYPCRHCAHTKGSSVYSDSLLSITDRKVRGSSPTSASRSPLSRLGQPGSISALVLPSGGMAPRHWKGLKAERLFIVLIKTILSPVNRFIGSSLMFFLFPFLVSHKCHACTLYSSFDQPNVLIIASFVLFF